MQVSFDDLRRMQALNRMIAAFPQDQERLKQRKRIWWNNVREQLNIPKDRRLKVRMESGTLVDADTGAVYEG